MADLGKAYVQIVPSAQGIKGSITQALGGEVDSAGVAGGTSLGKKIGSFAMKAFAAMEVGKFIKNTIQEGARYEQAVGGIETMFKESSDKMKAYANEAYKTAGVSANDYMEQVTSFSASLLQSLDGDTNKAADAANQAVIDMSDNANKFGTNIADIQHAYQGFAKQNYTMLDNLKLGYGGTKSEMERLLSDAEKITGKKYDISNLADVYEAIHAIQEEYGIAGTTAKEGSTTISGSFAQMKAAAQNFMTQLVAGEDVEGAMNGLIDSVIAFGGNIVPAFLKVVENLPTAIGAIASKLSDVLTEYLENEESRAKLTQGAMNFIKNFGMGLIQALPQLLEFVILLVAAVLQAVIDWQLNLLQTVRDFIEGTLLPAVKEKWEAIKTAIVEKVTAMVDAVKTWFINLKEAIVAKAQEILQTVTSKFQSMKTAAIEKVQSIVASVRDKFQSMKTAVSTKVQEIVGTVRDKFQAAKDAITEKLNSAKDKVKSIIDRIKGFFKFKISWPHIPLPHFSISPSGWRIGDLLKGSIPSLGIRWYAKGGIFNKPTVLSGLGDNGPEAALPLDPFWKRMDDWGAQIIDGMAVIAAGSRTEGDIKIQTYLYPNGPKMDEYTVKAYERGKARLR